MSNTLEESWTLNSNITLVCNRRSRNFDDEKGTDVLLLLDGSPAAISAAGAVFQLKPWEERKKRTMVANANCLHK